MAERRRLLIDYCRLQCADEQRRFALEDHESRYLRRVLRLRPDDQVDVVDGCGHLWLFTLRRFSIVLLKCAHAVVTRFAHVSLAFCHRTSH